MAHDEGEFDPYAGSTGDRYEAMARLRREAPVAATPAGWYVATAAGVLTGLQRVEDLVGSFTDTSRMPEDEVMISAIPEPRHGRIRRVINTAVAAHRAAQAEPFIRDLAGRLLAEALDEAGRTGRVDLKRVYLDPIPSAVIAHVLGVPVEDFGRFQRWSDELLAGQLQGSATTMSEIHPEFAAYVQDRIDERRAAADPPDDVITRLLRTEVDGEFLSDAAVRTQTMFLIVAGNETTRNLLGNLFHTLARDPGLYARVRADRALVATAVEESLRHDAPVQVLARSVIHDIEIEGCPLPAGEQVVLGLASANRDEAVHDDPADFRLDRARPREHLAFGAGPHVCPGASLARLEANVALSLFCERVAGVQLAPGYEFDPNPVFWALGPVSLPVTLTPAG